MTSLKTELLALCPYCSHDLKKQPTRQKQCPACLKTIYVKKPYPYTVADQHVPKVLMTDIEAMQRQREWDRRPKAITNSERVQPDGKFPDGRYPGESYYDRELRELRDSEFQVAGIEIVSSPAQPCEHLITTMIWTISDPPPLPPPDCGATHCMCWCAAVFPDELHGRPVYAWSNLDETGAFAPLPLPK